MLSIADSMWSLKGPKEPDIRSIIRFLSDYAPVDLEEECMHAEEDLVQLGDHEDEAWLDQALMSLLMKLNRRFVRVSLPVFLCLSLCIKRS